MVAQAAAGGRMRAWKVVFIAKNFRSMKILIPDFCDVPFALLHYVFVRKLSIFSRPNEMAGVPLASWRFEARTFASMAA